MDKVKRCFWAEGVEDIYVQYHDHEWGIPVYDDQKLFEMLVLESFQAGLSWITILKKRENFAEAFDQFNLDKIMQYDEAKILELMDNKGIIRNRRKIEATISNARIFKEVQAEYGSFANYLWSHTNHEVVYLQGNQLPTRSELSDTIASELKKRGMKFFGTVIVYAYLEAVGIVNDHEPSCFLYHKNHTN